MTSGRGIVPACFSVSEHIPLDTSQPQEMAGMSPCMTIHSAEDHEAASQCMILAAKSIGELPGPRTLGLAFLTGLTIIKIEARAKSSANF